MRRPAWTDFNESDAGITLLELFAWLALGLALGGVLGEALRRARRRHEAEHVDP